MKICLDTCAYSKLTLRPVELVEILDIADSIYIPTVVMGELFTGFSLGNREKENRSSFAKFLELQDVKVVTIDPAIADRYSMLVKILRKQGTPIPTNDIWIAAATLETGSRLITYDAHFNCIPGLACIAP
jgi:tRNA(fMet)-specific endonuclease VapC